MAERRWRRFGSVRLRMTLAAVAVVAVGLTGAGAALVRVVESSMVDRLRAGDRAAVEGVAELVARGRITRDLSLVAPALPLVQVITPSGDVLAASPSAEGFGAVLVDGRFVEPPRVVTGSRIQVRGSWPDRVRWEVTSLEVRSPVGPLTVVAASPRLQVDRDIDALRDALWVTVPLMVLAVGVLAWLVIGRALQPIDAIRAQVDAIGGAVAGARVPEPGTGDEVDRLARTMNHMLGRLEESSDRQRRFVSDASHELRSPVSSIRAQLEVALTHPAHADWEEVARGVLAEDDRLERLIGDLLELARIDEGTAAPPEDVDLDELVLAAVDRAARRPGPPVEAAGVSAVRLPGNSRQLERLVQNLLDNAARHARSRVSVGVRDDDGTAVLVVEDDGEGISEADRERVFERFTRLQDGRARDSGGTGLGLALVREVARRHRGDVTVEDGSLGGARFVVTLPTSA
jgi:signal transduction histidine kinase